MKKHNQETSKPSLSQAIEKTEVVEPMQEEDLFKANLADPSPRDQQDLMSLPFFSLSKNRRTEPIEYQQGNVKIFIEGRPSVGIATIWDADFLIWVAAQLNAALEAGERPSRRLWVIPYHFLRATRTIDPKSPGNYAYARFLDCLRRLQGTTIETSIKAGGEQIRQAWSWLEGWKVHEDKHGRMIGVE